MGSLTRGVRLWTALTLVGAVGCGARDEAPATGSAAARTETVASDPGPRPLARTARPRVVALGDSLTAGLGLPSGLAYPAILQRRIDAEGLPYEVINGGVSGDTSAGGLQRLEWALDGDVPVLIVALGGNDGLRGLPTEELKQNLTKIIERSQARGVAVVLAGMEAPPNWGPEYALAFHRVYPALAARYRVPLVPFLLQGVAGQEALNQPDGMHPTAEGARIVAGNVWGVLKPVLLGLAPRNGSSARSPHGPAPGP